MQYIIKAPACRSLSADIVLPASKSISNRVLIMNALAPVKGKLDNVAHCDDTDVMVKALASADSSVVNIGAAGTAMRFLTAYFSQLDGRELVLTGSERMLQRPIQILVDALNSLGASIKYDGQNGFPPLKISGRKLAGGRIELDGSVSSQYISALLMAAPLMENGLELVLMNKVVSLPYIQMTLSLMKQFGIESSWNGNVIKVCPQTYSPVDFKVESDWSASSYWFQIAALMPGSEITLPLLFNNSVQGDSQIVSLFKPLGVEASFCGDSVVLKSSKPKVDKYEVNLVEQPDLAQTFVVTCCMLGVQFCFSGLDNLKIKETDRIAALIAEMAKLGYVLTEPAAGALAWNGERCEAMKCPVISTYKDHRMAMAFAPAAVLIGDLAVDDPSVVSKSYPGYWDDLKKAGFSVISK